MLILNVSWTYIHFVNGKMGRKITGCNATMYRSYKIAFGILILVRTNVFYHYTSLFILIDNVIDNELMAQPRNFDEIFTFLAIEMRLCFII